MIIWKFTNRHTGKTVEVYGPRNYTERSNLKRALREYSTLTVMQERR